MITNIEIEPVQLVSAAFENELVQLVPAVPVPAFSQPLPAATVVPKVECLPTGLPVDMI